MVDPETVVRFVKSRRYSPMTSEELAARFAVEGEREDEFAEMLAGLELQGQVVKGKGRRWVDPERAKLVVGRLHCHPDGFGFVIPVGEGTDVYVPGENMKHAMHNDVVAVEIERPRQKGRRYRRGRSRLAGRVVRVIRRANQQIVGTFIPGDRVGIVRPDDPRILNEVYVPPDQWGGAGPNEKVLARITAWPETGSQGKNPEGTVVKVLGPVGSPIVDVQMVIIQFDLPHEFPPRALREAEHAPDQPEQKEKRKRRDLRRYVTVAIDPENARDRDDALSLYVDSRTGHRVVLVHIADVSRYVHPDSALDQEAGRRGTSVYLVSDFVPMLPKGLTQDVLSFAQGKDRLAKTVMLEFDDEAELVGSSICHSVVNLDRATSYTAVRKILDAAEQRGRGAAEQGAEGPSTVEDLVIQLDRLARQLRERRHEIGSVDLDVPEYDVRVDADGRVTAVSQIERDRPHDLVEEFMLGANCVVARFLREHELPAVYRVHEAPEQEDIAAFAGFVHSVLGEAIDPMDRRQLQDLLAKVAGTNLSEAVNMELLRCMKRATYDTRVGPHFALHFDTYCHFTSPIRRYPDLITHQILDQYFAGKLASRNVREKWQSKLPAVARSASECERRADEAEREIIKLKLLRFLDEHVGAGGEVFDAVITGVQEYGVFAQLVLYSVEGLIKTADFKDDHYAFDGHDRALKGRDTGRAFSLGQTIRVTIDKIDTTRRQMDLLPAQ